MAKTVLVVDYEPQRRTFIKERIKSVFPESQIIEEIASQRDENQEINAARADELARRNFDLVVYNTMSNPPPKLFIEKFKKNFPKSRVLLYTDLSTFSVGDFNEYRHADGMMSVIFPDDSMEPERIRDIQSAVESSSTVSPATTWEWLEPYTQRLKRVGAFVAALAGIAGVIIGFFAAHYDKLSDLTSRTVQ